ncbi:MAG: aldo/keto reductase [Bacteroidales bacterium]|nr:aldo/keto reductase [Bacteroidales bacterium]
MKRRRFIQVTSTAASLLSCFPADLSAIYRKRIPGKLEKRALGSTGENLSVIGFGGIVVMDATPDESANRVSEAIEYGVNYFDVAPSYGDAEIKLGPALEPYRKNVFLACKTQERKKEGAVKEFEQSLKNLRTDYFDLYQLHAVTKPEDVETIFGPDGVMEMIVKAKKEGKIRFIGFTAHSVEAAMALMDNFDFDTILFPFNYVMWHAGNFGPQVMERAHQKNMGILALKSMAKGPWPRTGEKTIEKCWYEPLNNPEEALKGLRFTLSHPVTAAIPPGNENLFKMALDLALKFEPLNDSEIEEMKKAGSEGSPLFRYPMEG